jgi:integrase
MAKKASQRAKGTGCLVKRGDIYMARWVRDGKVFTRTTEESDKDAAKLKLAAFLEPFSFQQDAEKLSAISNKIEGAEAHADALLPAMALLNAFKAYVASPNRPDSGPRTMNDYEGQFNRFIDWMKEHHPDATEARQVSKDIAFKFAGHIGKTLTPNSFNKYIVLLRRVWKVLLRHPDARLKFNPWEEIQHKTLTTHSRRELTVEELGRIIEASKGEMKLLLALGIYCGLRLGDAATLSWSNVDMVKWVITLVPAKTSRRSKKRVQLPIHKTLYLLLLETPESKRRGYVMPTIAARYHSSFGLLGRDIASLFQSVGIDTTMEVEGKRSVADCGYHSLRHTFVSLCAAGGVSQSVVQSLVGHGSPAMTQHYTHVSTKTAQAAIATLPNITGTDTPVLSAKRTGSKLEGILAMLDGLNRTELAKVIKYSTKLRKESTI